MFFDERFDVDYPRSDATPLIILLLQDNEEKSVSAPIFTLHKLRSLSKPYTTLCGFEGPNTH